MGIKINNNFDPRFGAPLDGRIVADVFTDLDDLVSDGLAYEGMVVYVKDGGAGIALNYQYMNTAVAPAAPVLEWIQFGGGGGSTTVHNDLLTIQGGVSNTEHYHLNLRQYNWVVDSVPFLAPTITMSSDKGPTWAYDINIANYDPIKLSSLVQLKEGVNVRARLLDQGGNPILDIATTPINIVPNLSGWVDLTVNTTLEHVFTGLPLPSLQPADPTNISGTTNVYSTEIEYTDLDAAAQTGNKSFTYKSTAQYVDEIWITPGGSIEMDPTGVRSLALGTSELSDRYDRNAAEAGFTVQTPAGLHQIVFVISDSLTGGDPTKIQVWQNTSLVYQYGSAFNTLFVMTQPYAGDKTASAGTNKVDFIQLHLTNPASGNLPFNIVIV